MIIYKKRPSASRNHRLPFVAGSAAHSGHVILCELGDTTERDRQRHRERDRKEQRHVTQSDNFL